MLTLEQFRATRIFLPHGFREMEINNPCYVYDLESYIECDKDGNNPWLVIGNLQWANIPLSELEELLYENHYKYEMEHRS